MNAWRCPRCTVSHAIDDEPHGRTEALRCPDCGITFNSAYDVETGAVRCSVRPQIAGLYRQGRCKHCGIPIFGYESRDKDDCGAHI